MTAAPLLQEPIEARTSTSVATNKIDNRTTNSSISTAVAMSSDDDPDDDGEEEEEEFVLATGNSEDTNPSIHCRADLQATYRAGAGAGAGAGKRVRRTTHAKGAKTSTSEHSCILHKTHHTSRHLTEETKLRLSIHSPTASTNNRTSHKKAKATATATILETSIAWKDRQQQAIQLARNIYHKELRCEENQRITRLLDMTDHFPKFLEQDVVYGDILGKGGFGTVREIRGFKLRIPPTADGKKIENENEEDGVNGTAQRRHSYEASSDLESRKFMAQQVFREEGHARYALKQLSPEIVNEPEELITGLADLVNEARILSAMEHPNIIKLRAIQAGDHFQTDFFLVMDRLYDTLAERMVVWRRKDQQPQNLLQSMTQRLRLRSNKKPMNIAQSSTYQERIVSAFHLSSALKYMHRQRLMHRDIKPENIGFDVRGDIKIFDFGLAKELPQLQDSPDSTDMASYKFTGMCGSPRYMAGEVAWRKPYNESADVYSFGILLWEILTLSQAYGSHRNYHTMFDMVWSDPHMRPNMKTLQGRRLPTSLLDLLKQAWHHDFTQRPSMTAIGTTLKAECLQFPGVTLQELGHVRRKSRVIYDKHKQLFRVNSSQFLDEAGKRREYKLAT